MVQHREYRQDFIITKWNMAFKHCESLCYIPVTYVPQLYLSKKECKCIYVCVTYNTFTDAYEYVKFMCECVCPPFNMSTQPIGVKYEYLYMLQETFHNSTRVCHWKLSNKTKFYTKIIKFTDYALSLH